MAHILVLYGTGEGQTAKIAVRIAEVVRGLEHNADVVDSAQPPSGFDPQQYDGFIIGASIHAGRYQQALVDFVKTHRDLLDAMPAALFLVSLSAAKTDAEGRSWMNQCRIAFYQASGWQPQTLVHFAGALKYRQYGLIKRWLMQRIAKHAGGATDTSRDYEYTDWEAVVSFARSFAADLPKIRAVSAGTGPRR